MIPEKIFKKLDSPKQLPFDGQFVAKCPCHNDEHPSLYIKEDEETGNLLLYCMAGCKTEDIVKALGLEMKDLFVNDNSGHTKSYDQKEKAYFYYDKAGVQVAKKVCYSHLYGSKTFCWFRLENGEWVKGLNGLDVPLYNLPSLLNATETVYIVESEKDADSLQQMGYIATTPPHGAGHKWDSKNYNKFFKNKDVVILADNDDVGRKHAKDVASCVSGVAKSVKLIPSENIYRNSYNMAYDDYVYVNEFGERIKPDKISRDFPKLLLDNNLKRIRLHDLRHSCASLLYEEGVPMKKIQNWLGHSVLSTTMDLYTHLYKDADQQCTKAFDDVFEIYN